MDEPKFNIGDKFKRTDIDDNDKIHTIDKISKSRGGWIYGAEGQGWADGWAWVAEFNIVTAE